MEIMTAKEKAIELVDRMFATAQEDYSITFEEAIDCALICVNEIIAELDSERVFETIYFWNEVKEEINKL